MSYSLFPSIKGQITIPPDIRARYDIGKTTPLVVEDQGNGVFTVKVMKMVDQESIEYYENDKELGLLFKKGIDAEKLLKIFEDSNG